MPTTGVLSALADSARSADGAAWSASVLARAAVARAHRRVVHGGTSISDSSPPEDLHLLRKRCKELRYALEMFALVLDDALWGSRSPPESVTCGDRQPCMIADVSLRLLYLIFSWLVCVRDASSG